MSTKKYYRVHATIHALLDGYVDIEADSKEEAFEAADNERLEWSWEESGDLEFFTVGEIEELDKEELP